MRPSIVLTEASIAPECDVAAETEEFDPYSVLGIHHDATLEQVRAAFRRRGNYSIPIATPTPRHRYALKQHQRCGNSSAAFDTLRVQLAEHEPDATPKGRRVRCPVCKRNYAETIAGDVFTCVCGTRLRRKGAASTDTRTDGEQDRVAINDLVAEGLLTADESDRLLRAVRAGVSLTCTRVIPALRVEYDDGRIDANAYAERRRGAVLADVHAS